MRFETETPRGKRSGGDGHAVIYDLREFHAHPASGQNRTDHEIAHLPDILEARYEPVRDDPEMGRDHPPALLTEKMKARRVRQGGEDLLQEPAQAVTIGPPGEVRHETDVEADRLVPSARPGGWSIVEQRGNN